MTKFDWRDPLSLSDQLGEEETYSANGGQFSSNELAKFLPIAFDAKGLSEKGTRL